MGSEHCRLCLIEPNDSVAHVPCGHKQRADELARMNLHGPLCRSDITLVMPLF